MNTAKADFPVDTITPTVERIAEECLSAMDTIARAAAEKASSRFVDAGTVMSSFNSLTAVDAARNLSQVQEIERKAGHELAREPLIARVKVRSESGVEKTYYFARNFTVSAPGISLTSYNSGAPIGRLAALDVGDGFQLPGGKWVEVVEKGTYNPTSRGGEWDGIDNRITHEGFDMVAVPSLRAAGRAGLLGSTAIDDPFADIDEPLPWIAPQRTALTGVGLRDQSVMNKVQDEIFRLPIDKQVMLEGPPGTGKTTTLIKRLSQKLTLTPEREEDMRAVTEHQLAGDHQTSWIMFSPTALLEHYLREAFARDNVPASQDRIQTWANFRNGLATRVLGILRSGKRTSGFLREDSAQYLSALALENQPEFYADFDAFQRSVYIQEIEAAINLLRQSGEEVLVNIARKLADRVRETASILAIYLEVDAVSPELREWTTKARADIVDTVDRRIEVIARLRGRQSITELSQLVAKIDAMTNEDDEDEEDTLEPETAPTSTRDRMYKVLRASIRAMAIAAWTKRAVSRSSKYKPVIEWLGAEAVGQAELERLGRIYMLISAVSMVSLTTRNYFSRLPQRYRAFRKNADSRWFQPEAAEATKVTGDELDLLVAVHLDAASELLGSSRVRANLTQGNLQVLAPLVKEFRNQVVVDEATDFSPLQLRAMACLATPGIRSFFACGDFNQRLTRYGVSRRDAFDWAVRGLEFHRVEVAYRQSKELRSFANEVVKLSGGDLLETTIEGPRIAEGYAPVVHVSKSGSAGQSRWIASRIVEIDSIHTELPSIAVFVPREDLVVPVADELRQALQDTNVEVMPCLGGQVLGLDRHVRVFAVEHIKGLEFEAAFFHSLNDLAVNEPDLFDKYLYVGATRAATFLGLACDGRLPRLLEQATQGMADRWSVAN
ncbi:hypothetical protein GQY15_11885 [Rhodobacter sphaeroides]|uniref:ATP-binding domain-containing protein n=1 Tax=Cereibacter sphaeroides TaxID=1063 RepID=UPI001321B430|nr:ATP-binding domain-containing protein [Cereibacter sphaeroides]MWP38297.1 hypothetical protein [Cereibacter sphaeroides]